MLEPGRYPAVVIAHHPTETANGKPYIAVTFKVTQGEMAGETIEWQAWMTTEGAIKRNSAALRACGWKGDDVLDIGEMSQEVQITVEHEEWNNKTRAKVAFVNPPRRNLDPAAAKKLSDRVRALAATAPLIAAAPPPPAEDDPFG